MVQRADVKLARAAYVLGDRDRMEQYLDLWPGEKLCCTSNLDVAAGLADQARVECVGVTLGAGQKLALDEELGENRCRRQWRTSGA